jgi:indole-3-glycerol phosphate synthase
VLDRILAETRVELERRKRAIPVSSIALAGASRPDGAGRPFRDALLAPGLGVIAEFKRRSPSAGALREHPDLAEIVAAYCRGGAVALSILTEGPNFDGSLEDLRVARTLCDLPLLRKDFILDSYQLHEARAAGADAVLLIVAALEPGELAALLGEARALGMDALIEVHDREELERGLAAGADIVGINNRDLRDFSVDLERTERLMDDVPAGVAVVSESGIAASEQLARLHKHGVRAVLVGESLMRAEDPAGALLALRAFSAADGAL